MAGIIFPDGVSARNRQNEEGVSVTRLSTDRRPVDRRPSRSARGLNALRMVGVAALWCVVG